MRSRFAFLLAALALASITIRSQQSTERFGPLPERPVAESRVKRKGPVAPAEEDRLKYASFLSQSGTGLVRLLPRWVKTNYGPQPPEWHARDFGINGGGSYFSFYYRTHEYGRGSDIELNRRLLPDGNVYGDHDELRKDLKPYGDEGPPSVASFSVGFAGADFGMITALGEVPIESINLDDARLEFLLKYRPPRPEPEARCEYRRFGTGVVDHGHLYKNRLPIQTGGSYLLRSIIYDKYDVLVAFQVVRQEADGSVTIIWKLLKKFNRTDLEPTPNLDQRTLQCAGR